MALKICLQEKKRDQANFQQESSHTGRKTYFEINQFKDYLKYFKKKVKPP